MNVKLAIWRGFNALGFDVRRHSRREVPRASMAGGLRQLTRLGFEPSTVIDVGVAYQTPELYQLFPKADILLIEPLAEFEPFLRRICSQYKAQYVLAAAGESAGSAILHVHRDKDGSSLMREIEGASVDGSPREVPVTTIDQQCAERKLHGPFLIKIDVQGAEFQVLAGAARALRETEAVILEVSLFAFYVGGVQFHDAIAKMKELGFVAYDVCGFLYRPLDDALSQVDMIFVREDGRFRKSHAYATPDQRDALDREMKRRATAMETTIR